jgi:hypothetical protein
VARKVEPPADGDFLSVLEKGIRQVLEDPKSKPAERTAAIVAGTRIALVRHKITGGDVKGFFE